MHSSISKCFKKVTGAVLMVEFANLKYNRHRAISITLYESTCTNQVFSALTEASKENLPWFSYLINTLDLK